MDPERPQHKKAKSSIEVGRLERLGKAYLTQVAEANADTEVAIRVLQGYLGYIKSSLEEEEDLSVPNPQSSSVPNPVLLYVSSSEPLSSASVSTIRDPGIALLPALSASPYTSIGRTLSASPSHRLSALERINKIVPHIVPKSAEVKFLESPESMMYVTRFNADVIYENKIVLQIDNVVQLYTEDEDEIVASAIGLLAGLNMKGAIPYRNFKTTFSSCSHLKGYLNTSEGDIYALATFFVSGFHSRVAARLTNYFMKCYNPAFRGSTEFSTTDEKDYLDVLNAHSAIICQ